MRTSLVPRPHFLCPLGESSLGMRLGEDRVNGLPTLLIVTSSNALRPGKLDLLFRVSHLLDLHVGGR